MAEVVVKFGADTADFSAELAVAQRQMQLAAAEMKKFATQVVKGGDSMDGAKAALTSWAAEANAAKAKIADLSGNLASTAGNLREAGAGAIHAAAGMSFFVREASALLDESLAGRTSQMRGSIARLAFGVLSVADAFSAANIASAGIAAAIAAAAGTLVYFSAKALNAKEAVEKLLAAAAGAGNFNNTAGGLKVLREQLMSLPDISSEAADTLAASLAKVNDSGNVIGLMVGKALTPLADAMGKDVPTAATTLAAAIDAPTTAGKALIESLGGVTAAEQDDLAAASRTGDKHQEQAVLLAALSRALKDTAASTGQVTVAHKNWLEKVSGYLDILRNLGLTTAVVDKETKTFAETLRHAAAGLDAAFEKAKTATSSLQQVAAAANKIAIEDNTLPQQLQESIDKVVLLDKGIRALSTLGAGFGGSLGEIGGDAVGLIRKFEGFTATAKFDRNAYRVGYGSDTTTDAQGRVHQVMADTVTTVADAERDLARRRVEFQNEAAAQVGPIWDQLSANTKASLTSVAYNYGKLPDNIVAAVKTGAPEKIASAIIDRQGDNGGVNAGRRAAEAANIASQGVMNAARDQQIEKQQRLNLQILQEKQAREGGTAAEKQALATLEAEAAGHSDNAKAARDKLAADEKDLAALKAVDAASRAAGHAGIAALEIAKAQQKVDEDIKASKAAQVALDKSSFDLAAARATKGSKEERDAKLSAIKVQEPGASPEQLNQLRAQEQAINDAFDTAESQKAAALEDEKYNAAKNGAAGRIALIKEEAQSREISYQDAAQQEQAVEAERLQTERAHWQALMKIWGQGTAQYIAAQKKLVEADSNSAKQRMQIQLNLNKQIADDYKSTFEQIGSTIASSITGMITGQTKLRDAARNILTQILQMFIQAKVKMVADWLAGVAAQTSATVTGQTAQTAAVTAGVAARTSAEATGSVAASAGTISAVLKSIMASASETFAGIFGFLSPVLGPAAAGPAAAGEATVLAVAGGLAFGAWELPRDMLVQAHRGEMVVPAGVTPWAQGLISGAANTPGVNTVHVHHATNFNVTAMDAQSFHSYAMGNRKTLLRVIHEGVRTGAHLGLSKLSPI